MTNEPQKGDKGKAAAKAASPAPAPEPAAAEQAHADKTPRYSRVEHLANANAMYGVRSPLVAAGLSILDGKGDYAAGYTKDEVASAIDEASTTPIKEG